MFMEYPENVLAFAILMIENFFYFAGMAVLAGMTVLALISRRN